MKDIRYVEMERYLQLTPSTKGIRLDVYVEDDVNTVYDVEMQTTDERNLPKRARYYQGVVDLNTISKGDYYTKLKDSILIFICTFDPFGRGLPLYHYLSRCSETDDALNDGSMYVFLNARGNTEGLSEDMKSFLRYLQDGKATAHPLIERIETGVEKIKNKEEWRVEYMTLNLLLKETEIRAREEAIAEEKAKAEKALQEKDAVIQEQDYALQEKEDALQRQAQLIRELEAKLAHLQSTTNNP